MDLHAVQRWIIATLAGGLLLGCTGGIGANRDPEQEPPSPGDGDGRGDLEEGADEADDMDDPVVKPPPVCAPSSAGRRRRLTRDELDQSLRALLADKTHAALALDPDPQVGKFDNVYDDLWVDEGFLTKYLPIAETVAANAASNLRTLSPCAWDAASEASCAQALVTTLGARLFRGPVAPTRATELLALFTRARSAGDTLTDAVTAVLTAMLLAPEFLYRDETRLDTEGGHVVGAGAEFQVATAVAFLVTGSTPDDELLAAAREGALRTREQIAAHATRLLATPAARHGILRFFDQLFEVPHFDLMDKDARVFPEFGLPLVEAMKTEARAFLQHAVFEDDGRLQTLLTSTTSFPSRPLASIYGVPAANGGPLRLPADQRAGMITQAGLLAYLTPSSTTNPVVRGNFLLETLLCTELAIPPDVMDQLDDVMAGPGASARERLALHHRPGCVNCHSIIDPLGLGLERYDALGRYQERDGERVIDASGVLAATDDQDGPFVGAVELAQRLARSARVRGCLVTQLARYALGRHEQDGDACHLDELARRFDASGGNARALVVDLVTSDLFLRRQGVEP